MQCEIVNKSRKPNLMSRKPLRLLRENIAIVAALVLVSMPIFFSGGSVDTRLPKYAILVCVVVLGYFLFIKKPQNLKSNLGIIVSVVTPITILGVVMLALTDPPKADALAFEDGPAEVLSALLLLLGSLAMVLFAAVQASKRQYLIAFISALVAIGFFVIGMEEVSWFQRVIGTETPDYFMQNNMQQELNLHNLNTGLSEKAYYAGAFILLTLLPFFRDRIASALGEFKKLKKLETLLPGKWIVLPFLAISGLGQGVFFTEHTAPIAFLSLITLIFSAYIAIDLLMKNTNKLVLISVTLSLLSMILAFTVFSFFDHQNPLTRAHFFSEYRELFIALGILVYSVDRLWAMYDKKEPLELET